MALELNSSVDPAGGELAAAMARQAYAWSVYHGTLADARDDRSRS